MSDWLISNSYIQIAHIQSQAQETIRPAESKGYRFVIGFTIRELSSISALQIYSRWRSPHRALRVTKMAIPNSLI
jgi:hypothetical protein